MRRITKPSWLLVDLDNTVLDFDQGAAQSLDDALEAFGISATPEHQALYKEINLRCWAAFERGEMDASTLRARRFQLFVRQAKLAVDPIALNRLYLSKLSQQVHEIEGARDFLHWAQSRFGLLLATNGFSQVQRPRIQEAALDKYFSHIVISEEIGSMKPDRAFFDHAFARMEQPPREEVMIIGDSLSSDMAGGADYGISTCWFNPTQRNNDGQVRPDWSVTSMHQLRDQLQST